MSKPVVLPGAAPEAVGLDPDRLARLLATLNADVARQKLPGSIPSAST